MVERELRGAQREGLRAQRHSLRWNRGSGQPRAVPGEKKGVIVASETATAHGP